MSVKRLIFLMLLLGSFRVHGQDEPINRAPFEARSINAVQSALGLAAPQPGKEIQLKLPEIASDGQRVPVSLTSRVAQTKRIALLGLQNEHPLLAELLLAKEALANAELTVRLEHTGRVMALVQTDDNKVWQYAREVKVTSGDCDGRVRKPAAPRAAPLTLAVSVDGAVRIGLPQAKIDKKLPPHAVQVKHLLLTRNEQTVLEFNWADDLASVSELRLQQTAGAGEVWQAEVRDSAGHHWSVEQLP